MPKRTDIRKIMIIGSGPIVIGQACEFDYSGTQGCRALREEGYEVVLVNSNPATIMTDPEMAARTYIEPLTTEFVAKIIERERPQALLPTLGGQTALNLAVALSDDGTLERFGVELIGAKIPAIRKAEDRELFKRAIEGIGLTLPRSGSDPHRQGLPADARRRRRDHPRDRRRDRRLQHPVRGEPRRRPAGGHRDEPARVALVGARLEGHRLPHREDRRQARGGLPPRRGPQRHHAGDAGLVRAGHRLLPREVPALA